IAHIKLADVLRQLPEVRLGLHHHTERTPEAVEVVDDQPPRKTWRLLTTSLSGMPRVLTLARSTSSLICGTLGRKVLYSPLSSGRRLASASPCWDACASSSWPRPVRSRTWN